MTENFFYILMSQKDMLKNQVLEEILRERTNYYLSKSKIKDFWLLISPKFLTKLDINKTEYFSQTKEQYFSVLLSSNKEFINWLKLRLGCFETYSNSKKEEQKDIYKIDGIFGQITMDEFNPLISEKTIIDPELFEENYKKILNVIENL